jgi:hypothetical protein
VEAGAGVGAGVLCSARADPSSVRNATSAIIHAVQTRRRAIVVEARGRRTLGETR